MTWKQRGEGSGGAMLREPVREVQPPEMGKAACMGAELHCNEKCSVDCPAFSHYCRSMRRKN